MFYLVTYLLTYYKRAITNMDNAQRALFNLLIARTRLTRCNTYETNYAPNVPYVKNNDTVNTILNNMRPDHMSVF